MDDTVSTRVFYDIQILLSAESIFIQSTRLIGTLLYHATLVVILNFVQLWTSLYQFLH